MFLHAFDCPSATGELPICTCGALFRFVLEFAADGECELAKLSSGNYTPTGTARCERHERMSLAIACGCQPCRSPASVRHQV